MMNDYEALEKLLNESPMSEYAEFVREDLIEFALLAIDKAQIEALNNKFTLASWHDTFVEVKKPNSDLIYRFKLDETNDS